MVIKISEAIAKAHNLGSTELIVVNRSLDISSKHPAWYSAVPRNTYDLLPVNLSAKSCEILEDTVPEDWVTVRVFDDVANKEYWEQSFPEWANDPNFFEKISDGDTPEADAARRMLKEKLQAYNKILTK